MADARRGTSPCPIYIDASGDWRGIGSIRETVSP